MDKQTTKLIIEIAKAVLMVLASFFGGAGVASCAKAVNFL